MLARPNPEPVAAIDDAVATDALWALIVNAPPDCVSRSSSGPGSVLHRVGERLSGDVMGRGLDLGASTRSVGVTRHLRRSPGAIEEVLEALLASSGGASRRGGRPRSAPRPRHRGSSRSARPRPRSHGSASRPAPAWITISARWCETMSCRSRAIRARSRCTASPTNASSSASSSLVRSASSLTSRRRRRTSHAAHQGGSVPTGSRGSALRRTPRRPESPPTARGSRPGRAHRSA